MHLFNWPTLRMLVAFAAYTLLPAIGSSAFGAQQGDIKALNGEWIYVEDRTEGRSIEEHTPPMSAKFVLRVEEDAVVYARPRGDERILINGKTTEVKNQGMIKRLNGQWKNGAFTFKSELLSEKDQTRLQLIQQELKVTPQGLLVTVRIGEQAQLHGVALYSHAKDIALPEPAKARISEMSWLGKNWISKPNSKTTEERWSPPAGGAMLGVSRTVSRKRMVAFEYLRIVERDGGLVFIAQPGGRSPTEFVLTEIKKHQAVFVNPRHDYPQRIVYNLADDGLLTASIGFANGGRTRDFMFRSQAK